MLTLIHTTYCNFKPYFRMCYKLVDESMTWRQWCRAFIKFITICSNVCRSRIHKKCLNPIYFHVDFHYTIIDVKYIPTGKSLLTPKDRSSWVFHFPLTRWNWLLDNCEFKTTRLRENINLKMNQELIGAELWLAIWAGSLAVNKWGMF